MRQRIVALGLTLLLLTGLFASLSIGGKGSAAGFGYNPDPGQTCYLQVPASPLSTAGLATPYLLSGPNCDEANPDYSAFVQAVIVAPDGAVGVYSPLVINAGQTPAAPPVVPQIEPGSTVGIWFGDNGIFLHLTGEGARQCVNGDGNSDFGQFAYCNATATYNALSAAVSAGKLVVPPLGTTTLGAACPTVDSFQIVDQDPNDNVQTSYLTGNDQFAQNTAANRSLFPQATVLSNPSDEALLSQIVDPALGCKPWTVPDLADPGAVTPALALDQFQSRADQAAPVAYVNMDDEMVLNSQGGYDWYKDDLYRIGVDEPWIGPSAPGDDHYYCEGLAHVFPAFLNANEAALTAAPSPAPVASNLYTFLAQRFVATYEMELPSPGTTPTCDAVTGISDPVSIVSEVVGATAIEPYCSPSKERPDRDDDDKHDASRFCTSPG